MCVVPKHIHTPLPTMEGYLVCTPPHPTLPSKIFPLTLCGVGMDNIMFDDTPNCSSISPTDITYCKTT